MNQTNQFVYKMGLFYTIKVNAAIFLATWVCLAAITASYHRRGDKLESVFEVYTGDKEKASLSHYNPARNHSTC